MAEFEDKMPELSGAQGRPRIVIVGLNFGRHILAQFKGPAANWLELAGVCDLNPALNEKYARENAVRAYATLDEVLADGQVEAVGLFTGPVGRAALIEKIISAGKHVITTKPFESDPEAALRVLQLARKLGRAVHLNSPSPLLPPDLQQIQDWRDEFDLGQPIGARADVWASYREEADGTWYDSPELCPAAPLFRLGIYLINDMVRIIGPARKIQVMESRLFTGRPTADNAIMGIEFTNGALANLFASFCVEDGDHYRNSAVFNFERGTIYRNAGPSQNSNGSACGELSCVVASEDGRRIAASAVVGGRSGSYDWESFALAARGKLLKGEVTPEEIVAGLHITNAMAEATSSGRTVSLY